MFEGSEKIANMQILLLFLCVQRKSCTFADELKLLLQTQQYDPWYEKVSSTTPAISLNAHVGADGVGLSLQFWYSYPNLAWGLFYKPITPSQNRLYTLHPTL